MNAERARAFLLSLPHVVETQQWGGIVFWVGDKAIGGKMFILLNPDGTNELPISYPAGPERFHELCELDGIRPAPYMARIHWVAAESWSAHRDPEWHTQLEFAHALTLAKLPPRTQAILALPKSEQKKLITERRKLLAAKAATKKNPSPKQAHRAQPHQS